MEQTKVIILTKVRPNVTSLKNDNPDMDICVQDHPVKAWSCLCKSGMCGMGNKTALIIRGIKKSALDTLWLIEQFLAINKDTPILLCLKDAARITEALEQRDATYTKLTPETTDTQALEWVREHAAVA